MQDRVEALAPVNRGKRFNLLYLGPFRSSGLPHALSITLARLAYSTTVLQRISLA